MDGDCLLLLPEQYLSIVNDPQVAAGPERCCACRLRARLGRVERGVPIAGKPGRWTGDVPVTLPESRPRLTARG